METSAAFTKSAADGTFRFERVPPGNYGVKGIQDRLGGGPPLTDRSQFTIVVRSNADSGGSGDPDAAP